MSDLTFAMQTKLKRFTSAIQRYPILRKLVISQLILICTGVGILYISLFNSLRSNSESLLQIRTEQVKQEALKIHENWLAWEITGMDSQLSHSLKKFASENGLSFIRVGTHRLKQDYGNEPLYTVIDNIEDLEWLDTTVQFAIAPHSLGGAQKAENLLLVTALGLILLFIFTNAVFARFIVRRVYRPIADLNDSFGNVGEDGTLPVANSKATGEIEDLVQKVRSLYEEKTRLVRQAAAADLARQVAHDVKSPLAALTVATRELSGSLDNKELVRMFDGGVRRIREIVEDLRRSHDVKDMVLPTLKSTPLMGLTQQIVAEKLVRLDDPGRIVLKAIAPAEACAEVNPQEFQRVLSNIIDNALDASNCDQPVHILISGPGDHDDTSKPSSIDVAIVDHGKGISPEDLALVRSRGFSKGKAEGTGLGLHYADLKSKEWQGSLDIDSTLGVGTKVTLSLPVSAPPTWQVTSLNLIKGQTVLALDDDLSMGDLWRQRLSRDVDLVVFSQMDDLLTWVEHTPQKDLSQSLLLTDLELDGDQRASAGLDIIRLLRKQLRCILVTGRDDRIPSIVEKMPDIEVISKSSLESLTIRVLQPEGPEALSEVKPGLRVATDHDGGLRNASKKDFEHQGV